MGLLFDEWNKEASAASAQDMAELGQHWGWMLATGIVFGILGIVALSLPVASTLGFTIWLGALLVVGGVVHLIQAFKLRKRHGATTRFFQALLSLVTGGLMLRYPGGGMLAIALTLSFYFFIGAAAQWILFTALRPHRGSGWGLVSSVLSFLLGFYIILTFPFSAAWVPGTLLGIDLLFAGSALVGLSLSARNIYKHGLETAGKTPFSEFGTQGPTPRPT